MSRRGVTLLIAGIGVLVSLVMVFVLPVPYVALVPGPTYNTLGPLNGKQVVQITGHRTYSTGGHLQIGTASYFGGRRDAPPVTTLPPRRAQPRPLHDGGQPE